MERWRWMPEQLGDRHLLVNIAAFRLDIAGISLTMKTVVGKEFTRTPFFVARVESVVVNPWWNVPSSIAVKELWPKQRRDPSYFEREHMVVVRGAVRQRPGPWNSLGRLKFNMPNPWTRGTIEAEIAAGTERTIPLTSAVPVYVLYWTALVADDGHVEFHRDHYDRDGALRAALE